MIEAHPRKQLSVSFLFAIGFLLRVLCLGGVLVVEKPSLAMMLGSLLVLGCEIATFYLLQQLSKHWQTPINWLVLYWWNPIICLVLWQVPTSGIAVVLFLTALLLWQHPTYPKALAFLLLGTAIFSQPWIAILAPCFWQNRYRYHALLTGLPLLGWLYFSPDWQALLFWRESFMGNSLAGWWLAVITDQTLLAVALLAVVVLLLGGLFRHWLLCQNPPRDFQRMLLWFLLFFPQVQLPAIVLLWSLTALRPGCVALFLGTTTAFLPFLTPLTLGQYLLLYFPVVIAFVIEFRFLRFPWYPKYPPVKSLDIIVPTLNEQNYLRSCLESLQRACNHLQQTFPISIKIFVVDGASKDQTEQIAQQFPVHFSVSPNRGRGQQIASGFHQGTGELVLVCHADAQLMPTALENLFSRLKRDPTIAWGVLGYFFNWNWWEEKYLYLDHFRLFFWGIAYGDQALFFRRQVVEKNGSIPEIPLMEDVELCQRLSHLVYCRVGKNVQASERRWENTNLLGMIHYLWFITRLIRRYLFFRRLGKDTQQLTQQLYHSYYGKKE